MLLRMLRAYGAFFCRLAIRRLLILVIIFIVCPGFIGLMVLWLFLDHVFGTVRAISQDLGPMLTLTLDMFPAPVAERLKKSEEPFRCPICYTECASSLAIIIPCGHLICWSCLEQLLALNRYCEHCPYCRGRLYWVTSWASLCSNSGLGKAGYGGREEEYGRCILKIDSGVFSVVTRGDWEGIKRTFDEGGSGVAAGREDNWNDADGFHNEDDMAREYLL